LCVDCFSLLVVVLAVLVVSPAASSLRQLSGFLKGGCCVSSSANRYAQQVVSEYNS